MENLEVITHSINGIVRENFGEILCGNFNEEAVCSFSTNRQKVYTFNNSKPDFAVTNIKQDFNAIKNLRYFHLEEALFMTDDYNIIINNEVLYTLEGKIVDISWSPHNKYFVVLDDKNNITGFSFNAGFGSKDLTVVYEVQLDAAVPNSVYVGWGSHNTQFRGSKKHEEVIEEIVQEYLPSKISWRGNGAEFVVNFWKDGRRYLKVFDSSLKPLYQSEVYTNLLQPTSFKGQGNCIACAAIHNNQNKIVIFEKNCLAKSEFFVPECKGTIKDILYHPELNILGVYSLNNDSIGYLNIYFNSNAKWYLKQQFLFESDDELKCFSWTPTDYRSIVKLSILTSKSIQYYQFRWIVSRSPVTPLVAVLNGPEVHFTLFSKHVIPPPLSGNILTFSHPINKLEFHPNLRQFLLIDSQFVAKVYEFDLEKFSEITSLSCATSHKAVMSLISSFFEGKLRSFVNSDVANEFRIPVNDTTEVLPLLDRSRQDYSGFVYSTGKTINGTLYEFNLRVDNVLVVNQNEVCSNVISIFIYKDYALFTHSSSKLFCIRMLPETLNSDKWDLNKLYSHEIEQGAKIVCVTEDAVVLQIPRGNLETITCRLISIDLIEKLLSESNWELAVHTIRQERLNWNLLIDLNPERFLKNIENFVKAASTVSVLNTIISEFNEKNCLKTLYAETVQNIENVAVDYNLSNVKKKIFSDILDYVIKTDPISNLVSIVTIQIKHFSLKSAMKSVCCAYEIGQIDACKKAVYQILLYTHSSNVINTAYTLYNIGFVGFIYGCCSEDPKVFEPELEKLKNVKDDIERRFEMNVHGKNFQTATKYLIRCKKFDENFISNFITKHNTQYVAYLSCSKENPNFKLIAKLIATKVSMKGKFDEAGLILYRARLLKECLKEFTKAANWSKVSSLVGELKLDLVERKSVFSELVENLVRNKKIEEAALCYQFEINDPEKAVEVWLQHQKFQKALNLAYQEGNLKIIGNDIIPAMSMCREALNDKIDEMLDKIRKYTERLEIVRHTRLVNLTSYNSEGYDQYEENDLYSESGSTISSRSLTGSSRSRGSSRSSKSHKKEAKKKVDLREGGFYEDIALIRQLHILITDIFKVGYDVREVCEAYMMVNEKDNFKMCHAMHKKLCEAQYVAKSCIPRIWTNTFVNSAPSTEPTVLSVIQNKDDLDENYRIPPTEETLDSEWKLYWFMEV